MKVGFLLVLFVLLLTAVSAERLTPLEACERNIGWSCEYVRLCGLDEPSVDDSVVGGGVDDVVVEKTVVGSALVREVVRSIVLKPIASSGELCGLYDDWATFDISHVACGDPVAGMCVRDSTGNGLYDLFCNGEGVTEYFGVFEK